MDRWIHKRSDKKFDLIFFRPGAGIKYIGIETDDPIHLNRYRSHEGALLTLLARAYERLDTDGEIFAETDPDPKPQDIARYERLANRLRSVPGIEVDVTVNKSRQHMIVHLVKRPAAPSAFPKTI
ncbi:hypothetical protein EBS80_02980 [bacterium]|nr:hypothetical protein [bacterium]